MIIIKITRENRGWKDEDRVEPSEEEGDNVDAQIHDVSYIEVNASALPPSNGFTSSAVRIYDKLEGTSRIDPTSCLE